MAEQLQSAGCESSSLFRTDDSEVEHTCQVLVASFLTFTDRHRRVQGAKWASQAHTQ